MKKPTPFTQSMIRRLIRSAEAAGWVNPEIEIVLTANGPCFRVRRGRAADITAKAEDDSQANEWDTIQ